MSVSEPEVTPDQLAEILIGAFRRPDPEFDSAAYVQEQLDFLNKGTSASFETITIVGPDDEDLGVAVYDFDLQEYVWRQH